MDKFELEELPKNILEFLVGYEVEKSNYGLSGSGVYRFHKGNKSYYLKIANAELNKLELEKEYANLKWLQGKIPVPEIMFFEKHHNRYYLLMTNLSGIVLEEISNVDHFITLYANTLRMIHRVDIKDCPNQCLDDVLINKAKRYMEQGNMDLNIEEEHKQYTPEQLFEKLVTLKPKTHEYRFIHGDYCPDNVIVNNNQLSGIIDVGRAGVGDLYNDIALAIRSIRHQFGERYIQPFLEKYGIINPDWNKIEFYILLDEFF